MKKLSILILILIPFILVSCADSKKAALKINGIQISADEFNYAFQSSHFFYKKNEGRKDFLDSFLSKKLMLLEAEQKGLDRNPEFLNDIQMFWEQGLIKLMIREKNKELVNSIRVSDKEVQNYYNTYKDEFFKADEFDNVKEQIKKLLTQEKQNKLLMNWVEELKNRADIKINYELLGIKP